MDCLDLSADLVAAIARGKCQHSIETAHKELE